MANKMKWYDYSIIALLVVGGISWGIFGAIRLFFNKAFLLVDLVGINFANIIYIVVGLASLYSIYSLVKLYYHKP